MSRSQSRALAKREAAVSSEIQLRALTMLSERIQYGLAQASNNAGLAFEGKRDLYNALGYDRVITPAKYWERYRRNGVARRIVNALPNGTWRDGAELIEDDDPEQITDFEEAWMALVERLGIWDRFRKADILAQLGRYSVILIGAPGALDSELPRLAGPDTIAYLKQYGERSVKIKEEDLVTDSADPRYGQPNLYEFQNMAMPNGGKRARKVHWTRVIPIADEAIEDDNLGEPRLASVWNWLDDLEKVTGSGSEAYWRRVQPNMTATLVPGATVDTPDEKLIEQEIDKLIHGMRRWARLDNVKLEEIGQSQVASFAQAVDSLIGLIVAGYGIPKRILMGSERGELASQQDRSNWDQQVKDRRSQFAAQQAVKPFVKRLTDHGALPEVEAYDIRWPEVRDLDTKDKLELAKLMADTNRLQGEIVITSSEIRETLDKDPLEEDEQRPIENVPRETPLRRLVAAKQFLGRYARHKSPTRLSA